MKLRSLCEVKSGRKVSSLVQRMTRTHTHIQRCRISAPKNMNWMGENFVQLRNSEEMKMKIFKDGATVSVSSTFSLQKMHMHIRSISTSIADVRVGGNFKPTLLYIMIQTHKHRHHKNGRKNNTTFGE